MTQDIEETLTSQWVAPMLEFQGQKLAPFTAGTQALWRQIISEEDKFSIYGSYLVFLLILIQKDKLAARKLVFKREDFRNQAQDWLDTMPRKALDNISNLAASLFKDVEDSVVTVIPEANAEPQKKIATPVN
jgi:hypothetical protein